MEGRTAEDADQPLIMCESIRWMVITDAQYAWKNRASDDCRDEDLIPDMLFIIMSGHQI